MPYLILIVLFSVPYFEFLVFAQVSDEIGGWSAIFLTLITAMIGIYLIKLQGIGVIGKLQENVQNGKSPVNEILHGILLLVAGLFFLLPGFITDSIALLLSVPFIRDMIVHVFGGAVPVNFDAGIPPNGTSDHYDGGATIDGEYEEDEKDEKTSPVSLENPDKDPKS